MHTHIQTHRIYTSGSLSGLRCVLLPICRRHSVLLPRRLLSRSATSLLAWSRDRGGSLARKRKKQSPARKTALFPSNRPFHQSIQFSIHPCLYPFIDSCMHSSSHISFPSSLSTSIHLSFVSPTPPVHPYLHPLPQPSVHPTIH